MPQAKDNAAASFAWDENASPGMKIPTLEIKIEIKIKLKITITNVLGCRIKMQMASLSWIKMHAKVFHPWDKHASHRLHFYP